MDVEFKRNIYRSGCERMKKSCESCYVDLVAVIKHERGYTDKETGKVKIVKFVDYWYCPECRVMYHLPDKYNKIIKEI